MESVLKNGIQKTSEQPTKYVNLQVSPLNDFGTQFHVNGVLVVDYMNVPEKKVKLQKLKEKWPHLGLSDVELTEVEGTRSIPFYTLEVMPPKSLFSWSYGVVRRVPLLVFAL